MFRRILVGIDFSPASHQALVCAAGLAKDLHLRLVAHHANCPVLVVRGDRAGTKTQEPG